MVCTSTQLHEQVFTIFLVKTLASHTNFHLILLEVISFVYPNMATGGHIKPYVLVKS